MHRNDEFIGVDVGEARIGIARGSALARLAEPLKTVPAQAAITEIAELAKQHQAAGIVIGLPRGLDGQETAQTAAVRQWVKQASSKMELPFYWQDEALTTQKAESAKLKAENIGTDAKAAAIILEDFLDTPPDQRVRY